MIRGEEQGRPHVPFSARLPLVYNAKKWDCRVRRRVYRAIAEALIILVRFERPLLLTRAQNSDRIEITEFFQVVSSSLVVMSIFP